MLTGYMEGVSLVKGINYLGYGPNPVGAPATATILDQDFVLYRLVSMIHMGKISNNTGGKLTIDSVLWLTPKKQPSYSPAIYPWLAIVPRLNTILLIMQP